LRFRGVATFGGGADAAEGAREHPNERTERP